jgi:glycosyltransferase involved in cell wall biosynthesis
LKNDGPGGVARQVKYFFWKQAQKKDYQKWVRKYGALDEAAKAEIARRIEKLQNRPLVSIVLPVYDVDEKWLRLCIDSVIDQIYPYWELCIADDASTKAHIRKTLEEFAAKDDRIKVVFRSENGHISAASNSALELATGEFTVLLDHDDELSPDALYYVAAEINSHPETQMIYSDEDLIDENGIRSAPKFKPDWSPDLFYSLNLITHLSAYRTETLRKAGGFRTGFEGSQDYDLALRVAEQISETRIRHIPKILYHWRAISGSVALDPDEKPYAHERARQALREHFERSGISAKVEKGYGSLHRVNYELPETVKISFIFGGDKIEAETLLKNAGHKNVEIVMIDGGTDSHAARLNAAAKNAGGDVFVFLKSGITPVSENWLREIASLAIQKNIGTAGAKLLYTNGLIHHGGIIFGINNLAGFAHRGLPGWFDGNLLRAQVRNNFSAVLGSCMATRAELFHELNGLDEKNLPNGLFDADYCLRLREKGYRIVWTPYAEFIAGEKTATEEVIENPAAKEVKYFSRKWSEVIKTDPYYNPNLTRTKEDFSVNLDPSL